MLANVKIVLFDMGGTLVDYPIPSWPVAIGRCLEGVYGYLVRPEKELPPPAATVPSPEDARGHRPSAAPNTVLPHRMTVAVRRMVRSISGSTLPRMAEACARTLVAEARLFADTVPTLRALEARGYPMGVVSNTPWGTPAYLWENQLSRFGLLPYFGVTCFSSGVGFQKPDGRIFQIALDRLGAAAGCALFVGDDPQTDIAGAARLGMHTAWLQRPGRTPVRYKRLRPAPPAELRLRSLRELLDHLPAPAKNVDLPADRS